MACAGAAPGVGPSAPGARLPEAEAARVEQVFEKRQTGTATYRAAIRQEVAMEGLRDPVVSEGILYYKSPGKLRINFARPPQNSVLVKDGKIFSKTNKGTGERDLGSGPGAGNGGVGMLLDFFQSGGAAYKGAYERAIFRRGDSYLVQLEREKAERGWPSRIEAELVAGTLEPKSVCLHVPGGTVLRFYFSEVRRDASLDEGLFAWEQSRQQGGR